MPSVQLGAGNAESQRLCSLVGEADYFVMCEIFTTNSGRTEMGQLTVPGGEMWARP